MSEKTDDTVNSESTPFWKSKSLAKMSEAEWESLCDGCGRCCLNKLEDWDTGEIHFTNIACTLFNAETCQCKDYTHRFETVPDCIKLKVDDIASFPWLPPTCAYRMLFEGRDLPDWHPLVTGDKNSVHTAGISVRGKVISEDGLTVEDYEDHLVDWVNK